MSEEFVLPKKKPAEFRAPATIRVGRLAIVVLVVTRLVNGANWFWGARTKPPPHWGWFEGWIAKEIQYAEIAPYKWFLQNIVQPNIDFFGWMGFITEVALTICLVLGILVGITGILAALWALNIAIGSYPIPGEFPYYLMFSVLVPLILAATRAGQWYGMDKRLRPRMLASRHMWIRILGEYGT